MADGKRQYPSGAAKRRKKAKKGRAAVAAEWLAKYEQLGPPPPDPAQRVEWANAVCALVIYEVNVAPGYRKSAERKLVLEGVRTLGMTAVKALYESRLKKLEAMVYGRGKDAGDGADGAEDTEPTA